MLQSNRVQDSTRQVWTREQVRGVLGVSEKQIRSWERQKLIPAASEYDFEDLLALRTLVSLRKKRVPAIRIRRAVLALREKLDSAANPLTSVRIFTEGKRIGVQVAGQKLEPVTGQLLLDFDAEEFQRMLSFPPQKRAEESRKQEGDRWFQRALEMETNASPVAEVIEAYQKAVELNPGCAGAYVNLGTIFFHARKWAEAEQYYRRAVETDAGYPLAQFNLGNLYDELGDRAKAMFHYQAALQLDPKYADAHYNVALLLQSSGQLMRALRHWKLYLRLDPTGAWAEIARRQLALLTNATVVEGKRSGT